MSERSISIRPEQAGDHEAIDIVLREAFGGSDEADLVARLRANGDFVGALVAVKETGGVVGYIAFPRLWIDGTGERCPAAGIAPLAVTPKHQRDGIGTALMTAGLAQLETCGVRLVFALGHPAYYPRFGFSVADAVPYQSEYSGPHFMLKVLNAGAPSSGRVSYPSAFAGLS